MSDFRQKQALADAVCLFLVQGMAADGKAYYCYIGVPGSNIAAFKRAMESQRQIELQSFGEIICWGDGTPDNATMERMTDEYGFDHQNMIMID